MKWMRFLVLLGAVCCVGCSGTVDTTGDENDPAVSGTDAEAMGSETGDVGVAQ